MDIFLSGYTIIYVNFSSHMFLPCKLSNSHPTLFITSQAARLFPYKAAEMVFIV